MNLNCLKMFQTSFRGNVSTLLSVKTFNLFMFLQYERMSAGHEPPNISRSKVNTRHQHTASLHLAVANMRLPILHFLSGHEPIFCVVSSSLQRSFCQTSAESVSLSGPGLHLSPAAGTWILRRQTVQGENCSWTRDRAWRPSEPHCPLCVSAGQDHEPRGSQLVSGSSFPSPQHPENKLMHLFWRNLTAQSS